MIGIILKFSTFTLSTFSSFSFEAIVFNEAIIFVFFMVERTFMVRKPGFKFVSDML